MAFALVILSVEDDRDELLRVASRSRGLTGTVRARERTLFRGGVVGASEVTEGTVPPLESCLQSLFTEPSVPFGSRGAVLAHGFDIGA